MKNLYLIEFYTTRPSNPKEGGWDINFAWVYAFNKADAEAKLIANQGSRYDCAIACEQHAEVTPLTGKFRINTPDANLFIIN